MKKRLIDAITAGRLAERAIKKGDPITNDDEVASAVEAISLSDVLKSVSDFSADDARKQYESKYNLKDGQPLEKKADPEPQKKEVKTEPEGKADVQKEVELAVAKIFGDLTKKLDTMGADIASFKTGRIVESRKQKLDKILKDLRDAQKKSYQRIPLDKMSDTEFDEFLTGVQEEVNDIVADNKALGAQVSAPLGGSHVEPAKGEASKEEVENIVKDWKF